MAIFNSFLYVYQRVCDGYGHPCNDVSLVQGGPLNTLLSTSADGFATVPGVCEVKMDGLSWDSTHLAEMGVSQNGWLIIVIIKIHDLEVPPLQETSIYIYIHTLWLFTKSELENHQLFIGEIIMFIIYKWTIFQSYVKTPEDIWTYVYIYIYISLKSS